MQRPISLVGVGIFVIFTVFFAFAFGGQHFVVHAQATGMISGTVTGDNNQPLANIQIRAYEPMVMGDYTFWNYVAETTTDATGTYILVNVPVGIYRIGFEPQTYPREYFPAYYDDASTLDEAIDVPVTANVQIENINAHLSSGAKIKGRVTGPSGEPLFNIVVDTGQGQFAYTDEDGQYEIRGLDAGTYRVQFRDQQYPPQYADEYYENADVDTATEITLIHEEIRTDINAQLDRLAAITGKVTDEASTPLSAITVVAQRSTDNGFGTEWINEKESTTDEIGEYRLTSLPAGIYRIWFRDQVYTKYSHEWFDNSYMPDTGTLLTVTLNTTTTNINAQLTGRGAITGVVRNEQNEPLTNIVVRADNESWYNTTETYTDDQGHYRLCCLNPDDYRLYFEDPSRRYIPEYYDDFQGNPTSLLSVTLVSVTPTVTTTNINANLTRYSTIAGRVLNEEGNPIDQVTVEIYQADQPDFGAVATTYTDDNGYFSEPYRSPGRYKLYFYDSRYESYYQEEFYDNASTFASATVLSVTKEMTTTVEIVLSPKARITGRVTDRDGNPLENIGVSIHEPEGLFAPWEERGTITTDSNGQYMYSGLLAGTYRIGFRDDMSGLYLGEFYDNSVTVEAGTDIVLSEGQLASGIDAQLDRLGEIKGQVTNENQELLASIQLGFYRYTEQEDGQFAWQTYAYASTDENGYYTRSVLPGKYRIQIVDYSYVYQHEWYDNQGYEVAATSIVISANTVLTNVNIQLAAEPFTWPPFAQNDEISVDEGGIATSLTTGAGTLVANDQQDNGGLLQTTVVTNPTHGTLTLNSDGTFSYQHDGRETAADHFTYRANDGVQHSNIATVTVTIQPINDLPTAVDDTATVMRGQSVSLLSSGAASVLANDSDPDDNILTATVTTQPQHGTLTLNGDGTFVYTHNSDTATSDNFGYKVTDGLGASDTATVTVTITEPAEAAFTFSKTVGIEGIKPACTLVDETKVPVETTIVYCYTVRNTGDVTLTTHSLVDSHLGQLLNQVNHTLAPGAVYSTTFTQTLTITTTNVATWTTTAGNSGQRLTPAAPTMETAATVRISGPNDDADGDTIPDNLERAGDVDRDNTPNFLDTDADGDGTLDRDEVGGDPRSPIDSDNDGIPDYLDSGTQPSTTRKILLPVIQR